MAKRNFNESERVKVDEELPLEKSTVRLLKSQYPARIKYTGIVTGKLYEWPGAGAVVSVDSQDADGLLSKMTNTQPCCNSAKQPQPKFVEV